MQKQFWEKYIFFNVGESEFTRGTPCGDNNDDQSTYEKKNYIGRPRTFNGDSTEFEWCKSKMYTHIIGLDWVVGYLRIWHCHSS